MSVALTPAEIEKIKQANSTTGEKRVGSHAGLWWTAAAFIAFNHVYVIFTIIFCSTPSYTLLLLTAFQAWLNLLGITAGYHRLWSHHSYSACLPVRICLMIFGTQAFQGSAKWWVIRHRMHHRFTDTWLDPHSSARGLFYSHIGWLFTPPIDFSTARTLVNTKDIDQDIVLQVQNKYLLLGYILFGGILPGLIGIMEGSGFWMGFSYIGMFGRFLSWHAIFSINSIAHWKFAGTKEFEFSSSAVSSFLLGFLQNGEGYHNYHHSFPYDYRHGHRWYEWDPTKWLISILFSLGLVSDLRTAPVSNIMQSRVQNMKHRIEEMTKDKEWIATKEDLPLMSSSEFAALSASSSSSSSSSSSVLLLLDGYVLSLQSSFLSWHPGGSVMLRSFSGCDVSKLFHGGLNMHTEAANKMAENMRIAKLID